MGRKDIQKQLEVSVLAWNSILDNRFQWTSPMEFAGKISLFLIKETWERKVLSASACFKTWFLFLELHQCCYQNEYGINKWSWAESRELQRKGAQPTILAASHTSGLYDRDNKLPYCLNKNESQFYFTCCQLPQFYRAITSKFW